MTSAPNSLVLARCLVVVGLALGPARAAAQQAPDLPDLSGAVVRSVVTRDADSGALRYEYQIEHRGTSLPITGFLIDLTSDPSRSVLSIDGLDNSEGNSPLSVLFIEKFGSEGLVAVAFPERPDSWFPGIDFAGRADWGAFGEEHEVAPGATQGGFVLLSRGIPAVRVAVLEPDHGDLQPTEEEREEMGVSIDQMAEELEQSNQTLSVVAPVAPPKDLDLAALVSWLRTQLTEARSLGWIQTDDALNSLQAMLQDLEAAFNQGQISEAKALTKAVVSFVDSQSCKSLSCSGSLPLRAETFALIRFNIDFLRAQLPNVAPDCTGAVASPGLFWPPDHEMVDVSIAGVTDADGDALTYQFSSVTQDEGVLEPGSGNLCPDALITGDSLQVRSERAGRLNGRVYRISFTAEDTVAATCSRTVPVCMPHEESETPTCIGEPEQHDSTVCP